MAVENNKKTWEHISLLLLLAAICAAAVFACLAAYRFDNKYTADNPRAAGGVLQLDVQTLKQYPIVFLIDGWEYYGGVLLSPEDFQEGITPDQYVFIGQYGGFEAGNSGASPHGSASYRLTIELPDELQTYMLELPEIFSAYRVYINGKLMMQMGDPDPQSYRPETGNRTVSIEAEGRIEILIAVSDFSHLYSGMVYPPAFGEPQAVSTLLAERIVFRSIVCAAALTIGLLSFLIGLLSRQKTLAVLYGLLCLFFVGYTSYPIVHTLVNGYYPFYALENFSFCAMLVTVILLTRKICGQKGKFSRIFILFGGLVCLASLVLPFMLTTGNLQMMLAYSKLISAYEWITAGFITFTAIRAVLKDAVHSKTLLCGIMVFDCALVIDRFLPLYEPIVFGWFGELASFVLVLSIGTVISKEVALQYRNVVVLEERANSIEKLSQMRETYYTLVENQIKDTKTMQHDMRHHFLIIKNLLKTHQYEELEKYVSDCQTPLSSSDMITYCQNNTINVIANHYMTIAEENRIELIIRVEMERETKMTGAHLCCLLSNLLENGVEACLRIETGRRSIRLAFAQTENYLAVRMENSTDGSVKQSGSTFLSSKDDGRKGYGLDSIKTIVEHYDGNDSFNWDSSTRVFTALLMMMEA